MNFKLNMHLKSMLVKRLIIRIGFVRWMDMARFLRERIGNIAPEAHARAEKAWTWGLWKCLCSWNWVEGTGGGGTFGVKKWVCDKCGEGVANWSGLKRHIMIHTGERPFACDVCGHGFRLTEVMKTHLRGHEEGRRLCLSYRWKWLGKGMYIRQCCRKMRMIISLGENN